MNTYGFSISGPTSPGAGECRVLAQASLASAVCWLKPRWRVPCIGSSLAGECLVLAQASLASALCWLKSLVNGHEPNCNSEYLSKFTDNKHRVFCQ